MDNVQISDSYINIPSSPAGLVAETVYSIEF
jgi:hypothetical protein